MPKPEISLESIKNRKENRKETLDCTFHKVSEKLKAMGAVKIILFGSYPERRVRSWSDLDIIAVMPGSKTGKKWMREIYDTVDYDVDCDILAYANEELEKSILISRFLRHALKNGSIIYERESEK